MTWTSHRQYDDPTFSRRRAGGEWVWSSSAGRGKSGLGAPRWKRISSQHVLPAASAAEERSSATGGGEAALVGSTAETPLHARSVGWKRGSAKEPHGCVWKVRDRPAPQTPPEDKAQCPVGHDLKECVLDLPCVCGVCNRELGKGKSMWRCLPCDFDACMACRDATAGVRTALCRGAAQADISAQEQQAASPSASTSAPPEGDSVSSSDLSSGGNSSSSSAGGGGGAGGASPQSAPGPYEFCATVEATEAAQAAAPAVDVVGAWGAQGITAHYDLMGLAPDFLGDPSTAAACPSWWHSAAGQDHTDWNSGSMMVDMMLPHLAGDETLLGPDGEWYEVFYPADGATPSRLPPLVDDECCSDLSTSATSAVAARTEEFTCRDSFAGGGSSLSLEESPRTVVDAGAPTTSASVPQAFGSEEASVESDQRRAQVSTAAPFQFHRRAPAATGIADMMAYMSQVACERYPARAKLFETVQQAATEALGAHFSRFALIGSTALGIDTPDSDLDAVAFTSSVEDESGYTVPPPGPVETLRSIAARLGAADASLQLQLVDCTRVPVLTVVTADSKHSLDLTVDEPLGERHVMWFRSHYSDPDPTPAPLYQVPMPPIDAWAHGLEAAVLRCVKWWLRRRGMPVAKEGGYPSVVWTLMVIHVLRCSAYVNSRIGGDNHDRARDCLAAMAEFFDRFAVGGLAGTLCFASAKGAEFWPQQPQLVDASLATSDFSVLDPTTTCEGSAAWGIEPLELAPRISPATQLLHAYELRRAQILSAAALVIGDRSGEWATRKFGTGGAALQGLFAEVGESVNVLPSVMAAEPRGAVVFADGRLHFGMLQQIRPKPGWCASFLHRRDASSGFLLHLCDVDTETGIVRTRGGTHAMRWFHPCDFVFMASLRKRGEHTTANNSKARPVYELEADSLERWADVQTLVTGDFQCHAECDPHAGSAATAQSSRAAHAPRGGGRRGGKRKPATRQQARA